MPMYEIEWVETRVQKALVMVPSDAHALEGAKNIDDTSRMPEIVTWAVRDNVPILAAAPTTYEVTALGRVEGEVGNPQVRPL